MGFHRKYYFKTLIKVYKLLEKNQKCFYKIDT